MRLASAVVVAAALAMLAGCDLVVGAESPAPPPSAQAAAVDEFLQRHWRPPLAPQGAPPPGFAPGEASLAPAACGECHPRQYADWRGALHSKAMSPGLFGQLQAIGPSAVDEHQACLRCHAPLAEQARHLAETLASAPRSAPVRADGASHADGLSCAGCHVRKHRRFGPPRRDGSLPAPDAKLPHDGWQVEAPFSDSRFCAACHQFAADGPAINGKLLQNTYEEWRASRHAREGRPCQSCHMPQRRHLWRGIHDAEMVRSGLDIVASPLRLSDGRVRFKLAITNRNVGHAFPTYVTPRVIVEFAQQDRQGRAIPGTVESYRISRDLSLDLATEHADTRIFPDEVRRYRYDRPRRRAAVALQARIIVEPDAFYAGFYRATLRDPEFREGRPAIREALLRARKSRYVLYQTRHGF